METFKVKSTIKHDGQLYTKGKKIELSKEVAKSLLEAGAIARIDADGDEVENEHVPQTKAEIEAARQVKRNEEAKAKALKEAEALADGNKPKDDGLEALTVPKLLEIVKKEKIETVTPAMLKADIVEAIRVARGNKGGDIFTVTQEHLDNNEYFATLGYDVGDEVPFDPAVVISREDAIAQGIDVEAIEKDAADNL